MIKKARIKETNSRYKGREWPRLQTSRREKLLRISRPDLMFRLAVNLFARGVISQFSVM